MKTDSSILIPSSRQPPHEMHLCQCPSISPWWLLRLDTEKVLLWIFKRLFLSFVKLFNFVFILWIWLGFNAHRSLQTYPYKIPWKQLLSEKHKLYLYWFNNLGLSCFTLRTILLLLNEWYNSYIFLYIYNIIYLHIYMQS